MPKRLKLSAAKENITGNEALVPYEPNFDEEDLENYEKNTNKIVPLSQNVVQNQLRQAANMFQSTTFNNCNITFQI